VQINVEIDNTQLLLKLRNGEKRLAYATVNAIRATVLRVQQAEFQSVRERFNIRNERFFFGAPGRPGGVAARIKPFPSVKQQRPFAEVFVAQAADMKSQRRLLLSIFERGGTKTPRQGSPTFAIPLTGRARPSMGEPVSREYTFAGMGLKAFHAGKRLTRERRKGNKTRKVGIGLFDEFGRVGLPDSGGGIQWKGRSRTFLLTSSARAPLGGVFRRTGPKDSDVEMLYKFAKSAPIDSRLEFVPVAQATARAWFREEMEREVIKAIEFSRGQGL
jgi:hypothetical protein